MRFHLFNIIIAILATFALAQSPNSFNVPTNGYATAAGQTVALTWSNLSGSRVTLTLRSGNSNALDAGTVIVAGLANTGSYSWTVPANTVQGNNYAIQISNDENTSQVNFTPQFPITSTVLTSAGSSSGTTATTGTTSTTGTTGTTSTTGTTGTTSTTGTSNSSSASRSGSASSVASSVASSLSSRVAATSTSVSTAAAAIATQAMGIVGLAGAMLVAAL